MFLVIQSYLFLWVLGLLSFPPKGFASFGIIAWVAQKSVSIFTYIFFWIFDLKLFILWSFFTFLGKKFQKNKDILPLETCVFFHLFYHYYPLYVSFLSFLLNLGIHYSSLFYVFNLSLFLTKNKRATTVHNLETEKMN